MAGDDGAVRHLNRRLWHHVIVAVIVGEFVGEAGVLTTVETPAAEVEVEKDGGCADNNYGALRRGQMLVPFTRIWGEASSKPITHMTVATIASVMVEDEDGFSQVLLSALLTQSSRGRTTRPSLRIADRTTAPSMTGKPELTAGDLIATPIVWISLFGVTSRVSRRAALISMPRRGAPPGGRSGRGFKCSDDDDGAVLGWFGRVVNAE